MTGIKLVQFIGLQEMPDLRRLELQRIDKMKADKGRDPQNVGSFLQPALERFPFQPGMPRDHKDVIKDERLDRHPKFPSQFLPTDQGFHDLSLKNARIKDQENRIETRREVERTAAEKHAEQMIQRELDHRTAFFHKARKIAESRVDDQTKAREIMLAYFEFVRTQARDQANGWRDKTHNLIVDAADNRREWLEWRMSQLFLPNASGGITRAPGRGVKLEVMAGEIYARQTREQVEGNLEWRGDNRFIQGANGSMVRDHSGAGGMKEVVFAQIFLPLIKDRSLKFRDWHDSNSQIETPNGGLINVKGQGSMPETATARLQYPILEARTKSHWDFQHGGKLVSLPNGSLTHAPHHGQMAEVVHAAEYWPDRQQVSLKHAAWHEGNKVGATPNGGFAPLANVGQSLEAVTAEQAQPLKDQRTAQAIDWHKSHRFGPTPNGGFAPLAGVGHSYEKVTADHAQPTNRRRTELHQADYEGNRYETSSNNSLVRVKVIGDSPEKIFGDIADITEDEALRGYNTARKQTKEDFLEQVELKHKDVSKTYRKAEMSEQRDESPQGSTPLPGAGEPRDAAMEAIADQRQKKQKLGLREIQRNLAAHEPVVSHLQNHAIKREK